MTTINGQNPFINSNVKKNNVQNDTSNNKINSTSNENSKSYGVTNESEDSPEMIITDDASDVNEAKDTVSSMKDNGTKNINILHKLFNMSQESRKDVAKSTAEVSFIEKGLTSECEEVKKYNEQALKKEENEIKELKTQIEENNKRIEELSNKEKNGKSLSSDEKSEIKDLENFGNTLSNRLNNRADVTVKLDSSDIDNMAAKLSEAVGVAQDATEIADELINAGDEIKKMDVNEYISEHADGDLKSRLMDNIGMAEDTKLFVGEVGIAAGNILGGEALELADKVVDVAFEKNIEIADKSSLNNLADKEYAKVKKYVNNKTGEVGYGAAYSDASGYSESTTFDGKMKNADKLKNG